MSGLQTMLIGLTHHDLFSYYGFFSAAIIGNVMSDPKTALNGTFANAKSFNIKVKGMWFWQWSQRYSFIQWWQIPEKNLLNLGSIEHRMSQQGLFMNSIH